VETLLFLDHLLMKAQWVRLSNMSQPRLQRN